jgi:hypothetical protein
MLAYQGFFGPQKYRFERRLETWYEFQFMLCTYHLITFTDFVSDYSD